MDSQMGLNGVTSGSISQESARILHDHLLHNRDLAIPAGVKELESLVIFTPEIVPFMPTPMKLTESCAALWGCIGLFSSSISQDRYGLPKPEKVEVDVHAATLMIFSLVLFSIGGKGVEDPEVSAKAAHLDKGNILERYRGLATNIYKTKDGKYFHLHGSLDTTHVLNMLGLPQHRPDLSSRDNREAIKDIYQQAVGERESQALEIEVNERWRQPGVTCLTVDEFEKSPHGQQSIKDPLYDIQKLNESLQPTPWPSIGKLGSPLSGIKVLDLTKVVAGPTITRVLALLGADVLRISTDTQPDAAFILLDGNMGKRDTNIDMKTVEGKAIFEKLLREADVVVDGFRPGALAKLGFSRTWAQELARQRGKGLIYCRENCYGWNGEWSHRAGYQQISDCVSGASWEQGLFFGLNEPVVPLLPNSDYQTGLVGAIAVSHALIRRASEGGSYNVNISLTQFNNWYIRDLGLYDKHMRQKLRALHPDLNPRHNTELFELISLTIKSTLKSNGDGKGQLWDPARWTTGPIRWGVEGEIARYLDWRKIVTINGKSKSRDVKLDFEFGSGRPGLDKAEWL